MISSKSITKDQKYYLCIQKRFNLSQNQSILIEKDEINGKSQWISSFLMDFGLKSNVFDLVINIQLKFGQNQSILIENISYIMTFYQYYLLIGIRFSLSDVN